MQDTSEAVTAMSVPLLRACSHAFKIVFLVCGSSNKYPSMTITLAFDIRLAKHGS